MVDTQCMEIAPIKRDVAVNAYGQPLDAYGIVALDVINHSAMLSPTHGAVEILDPIIRDIGGEQTLGDMVLRFWNNPDEVERIRERVADEPVRMIVAIGLQSRPQRPRRHLEIYMGSSLGQLLFNAERELKRCDNGKFAWAAPDFASIPVINGGNSLWISEVMPDFEALLETALTVECARIMNALWVAENGPFYDNDEARILRKYVDAQSRQRREQADLYNRYSIALEGP